MSLPGKLDLPVHVVKGPAGPGKLVDTPVRLFAERKLGTIRADGCLEESSQTNLTSIMRGGRTESSDRRAEVT